jgi:hypothetical protein
MEYHAQRAEDGDNEDDCYFDLQAFFDGIPHQRCLASLHSHGVSQHGKIHKWIASWLGAAGEVIEPGAREQEQGAREQEQGGREQEPGGREQEPRGREQEQGGTSQDLQNVRRRQRVILNGKASQWHEVTASII